MILDLTSHRGEKPPGRVRQKNEKLIIASAEQEFADLGYAGATMDSIARRAGIPRANLHYYFDSKLVLYATILSSIIDLWDHALNELDPTAEPEGALREYIARKIDFSRGYPLASRIFAKEVLSGAPRLESYFDKSYTRWFRKTTQVFVLWAEQGKIKPLNPSHIMFLIWSSTQHYADFERQICAAMGKKKLTNEDYSAATDTLVNIIVGGLVLADAG